MPDGRGGGREASRAFAFADYLRSGETRVNMMHDPSHNACHHGGRARARQSYADRCAIRAQDGRGAAKRASI